MFQYKNAQGSLAVGNGMGMYWEPALYILDALPILSHLISPQQLYELGSCVIRTILYLQREKPKLSESKHTPLEMVDSGLDTGYICIKEQAFPSLHICPRD